MGLSISINHYLFWAILSHKYVYKTAQVTVQKQKCIYPGTPAPSPTFLAKALAVGPGPGTE